MNYGANDMNEQYEVFCMLISYVAGSFMCLLNVEIVTDNLD